MIAPPLHEREEERLQRLRHLGILDTDPSESFDRLTRLAARIFGTPIALVSLVDRDRQWFKSRVGLEAPQTGRDISFCGHAVAQDAMLVVEDALGDRRFADNPLVVGPPRIRFYAGMPLHSADGLPLGTLCIIDRAPRPFGPAEREALRDLAHLAEGELRRHRVLETVARNLGRDRQLRTVLGFLPDAAFACDAAGEIITANPAARTLLGRRIRDMLGTPAQALFPGATYADLHQAADAGVVKPCRRADGTVFPGRLRRRHVSVDGTDITVFTVSDVSDWLERERRLAEQAELLDMANDAIVVTDAANIVVFWSRGAEKMYGIAREAALGSDMARLVSPDLGVPELAAARDERFLAIERSGYWEGDLEHRRADGTPITVFSRWSGRRDESGRIVRVLKINTDITSRREVERIKDELISVVNHELRTPLTSIIGAIDLAVGEYGEQIGAEAMSLIEVARRNGERLARLVNDVLDAEKIAAGKIAYRREVVAMEGALQEALECVSTQAARQSIRIEVLPPADARVLADHDRVVQVLTNLLSNAVKFSPPGETVRVEVRAADGYVQVAVKDRGPGIAPDFADRVFKRFAQAESSSTRKSEGTGLGLAISKGLVEAMNGSIGYESRPGMGATFTVALPAAA